MLNLTASPLALRNQIMLADTHQQVMLLRISNQPVAVYDLI